MKEKLITIVHTSLVSHGFLSRLFEQMIPEARLHHIMDDSLLSEVSAAGAVTPGIVGRLCKYFDAAASIGSDLIINQCSSVGEAAEIAARTVSVPVLRIDEAMAERAVELGERIGVVATVKSTVSPSCNLIRRKAQALHREAAVTPYLVEGALELLMKEGQERHNAYVKTAVERCAGENDVVVLAQGSMVVLLPELGDIEKPVLSSPRLCAERARAMLFG